MHAEINPTNWTHRIFRRLRSLLAPRAIVLGVSIAYFLVMAVRVARWYQQVLQAGIAMRPNYLLDVPFWLIVAASLLVIRRWWSELLASLITARLLYMNYLGFRSIGYARAIPPFSSFSLRIWWTGLYVFQPQEFLEIALALVIACYALVSLSRRLLRQRVEMKPVKTG